MNTSSKNHYLQSEHPIINSEVVSADTVVFTRDIDYSIDYERKLISLSSDKILTYPSLRITYKIIPAYFLEAEYLYKIQVKADSQYVVVKNKKSLDFLDNSKLNINGSKTFGISYSNSKEFDLNQSLFLKLSGELSKNLYIDAQLSDSNSPISTDGSSKELSSLDKVFIKLYNDYFDLSFGDVEYKIEDTDFINYYTLFEGFKFGLYRNTSYDNELFYDKNQLKAAIAVSKGKPDTYSFNCIDGKQGPYYIYINDNQTNVSIIAGTEALYIDGNKAQRGIDYYIDYSDGSITFEEIVSSQTEIFITFEYSNEKYNNTSYVFSGNYSLFKYGQLQVNVLSKADDKDNPLEDVHTQEDLIAFKEAGDSNVITNGIYQVETGQGNYIQVALSDSTYYYEYVGLNANGQYNIFFSYVGNNLGSYNEYAPDKFEYVGLGNGNYIPARILEAPKRKTNYDALLTIGNERVNYQIEALFSENDQNTFSDIDDSDNQGFISRNKLNINLDNSSSKFKSQFAYTYKSKNVSTFQNLENPLELNYLNIDTNVDSIKSNNYNLSLNYSYDLIGQLAFDFIKYNLYELYTKDYYNSSLSLIESKYSPKLRLNYIYSNIDFEDNDISKIKYNSYLLDLHKNMSVFSLDYNHTYEKTIDSYESVGESGNDYRKSKYSLASDDWKYFNSSFSFSNDETRLKSEGWKSKQKSITYSNSNILSFENSTTSFDFTHKEIDNKSETENDQDFDFIEINSNNNFFDQGLDVNLGYKINNLEFYPKVKELQYVGDGLGDLDSLGVYDSEGDYEWVYINSGQSELSTELNFDSNINVRLGRFTSKALLRNLSLNLNSFIAEESNTDDKIDLYLLKPSSLMNSRTTLYGRNYLSTSMNYRNNDKSLNYIVSYDIDKTLDNRYQESDKITLKSLENELLIKKTRFGNLSISHLFRNEKDTKYQSDIDQNRYSVKNKFSYLKKTQFTNTVSLTDEDGSNQITNDRYRILSTSYEFIVSSNFISKYLLQFNNELKYNIRSGSEYLTYLPDKREGISNKWNISLKYKYNKYVTVNFNYSGDKYPEDKVNNKLNIEVKAEF